MTVLRFQHATPALRTFCGPDALAALPAQLDRLGLARVVILCDPSIPRSHGEELKRVESALGERLAARFADVEPHSPLPVVEAAGRLLAEARADAVVAVGGGSSVVTARAASILVAEKRDVRDLCTRREADGRLSSPRLSAPKLPQWIVPTTPTTAYARAGSAVRDPVTGDRLALFDPQTRAQGIFFDPALALTAPASLARSAALNAFAMAVEGLQAKTDDPLAEALLTHALSMLVESLPRLKSAPDDPDVRLRLMLAALLSGQGSEFTSGGLAQALSHAAGPRSTTSNGVVEALLLPHTMRYNAPVTGERLERIGKIVGGQSEGSTSSPEGAVNAVELLLRSVGVPLRLREAGVAQDSLPEVIAHALEDWFITRVPRTVDRHDLEGLLNAAW